MERLPDDLASEREVAIREYVEAEVGRPFDLVRGPLLQGPAAAAGETEHVLVLTLHHIVADGWSMPIMVDELVQLYAGYSQGHESTCKPCRCSTPTMPSGSASRMAAGEQERQLAYWTRQLGGEQPVLELPTDRPRPTIQSHVGERLAIELAPSLADSLKAVARSRA